MGFEVVARTAPRDVDAIEAWREALVSELRAWADAHGGEPPRVMDWNRAYARRHGARFEEGWPTSYMVNAAFGSWNAAIRAAGMQPRGRHRPPRPGRPDQLRGLRPRLQRVAPQGRPVPAVRELPVPQQGTAHLTGTATRFVTATTSALSHLPTRSSAPVVPDLSLR